MLLNLTNFASCWLNVAGILPEFCSEVKKCRNFAGFSQLGTGEMYADPTGYPEGTRRVPAVARNAFSRNASYTAPPLSLAHAAPLVAFRRPLNTATTTEPSSSIEAESSSAGSAAAAAGVGLRLRRQKLLLEKLSGVRKLTTFYFAKNDHRWVTFILLKTINSDPSSDLD